jgi:hypothetical protein
VSGSISALLTRLLHEASVSEKRPRAAARGDGRDLRRRLHVPRTQGRLPWPRRDRSRRGCDQGTHPDFQYRSIGAPEELGNGGRIQWVALALR